MTAVRSIWGPVANGFGLGAATAITAIALNDADNSIASTFMVEKDGTIDRIGFYVTAKTGASTTVKFKVGLVTLDASGNPTTSAYGGSAPGIPAVADLTAASWNWVSLATPATANAGDRVAARIWPDGTVNPDGSNNITVNYRHSMVSNLLLPYPQDFQTAWTKNVNYPAVAVRYNDNTVGPIIPVAATTFMSTAYNTGTTPDERGALLTVPFAAQCSGARLYLDPVASGDCTVKLYNAANTLLGSAELTISELQSVSNATVDVYWDAASLTADANYRLTLLPTTANSVQLGQITCPDADSKARLPEGSRWQVTSRADAGAWDDSSTLVVPLMALHLSDITTTAAPTTTLFMLSE